MTTHVARLKFALLALVLLSARPSTQSTGPGNTSKDARPFDQAALFFELNNTDGDLGLHATLDGAPWTTLQIGRPGGGALLDIAARRGLGAQGLTEFAFESAEPSFDTLTPQALFERFPEGRYDIVGRALEGGRLYSAATLAHVMPAPPGNIQINGVRAAERCGASEPDVVAPVKIDWDPVTRSHPGIGRSGAVTIARYQLFVEGTDSTLSVDLPPSVTEFEVPKSVTAPGSRFKFEIIARSTTGNNTAVESCFLVH
jgi:hypothetical protein